jgi:hypothetical protein
VNPVTLYKPTPTTISILDKEMSIPTFTNKMKDIGFDSDILSHALRCIKVGGKWVLNFTNMELVFLLN